jgi:hypothetical protein
MESDKKYIINVQDILDNPNEEFIKYLEHKLEQEEINKLK